MEKMLIKSVAKDEHVARISIVGLPDEPGIAFKVFSRVAKAHVNVDIILQSVGRDGTKDITFTVTADQCATAIESIKKIEEILKYKSLVHDESVCKVSIVGTGMQTHPGVAAKMFEALSDADINIQTISTSEIKISVLVDTKQGERALNVVHDAFML